MIVLLARSIVDEQQTTPTTIKEIMIVATALFETQQRHQKYRS
jgi:hypothetical protein